MIPDGYAINSDGEGAESQDSIASLAATAIFFLTMMVVVIVISLNSFRLAVAVLLVALLSVGAALLGAKLSGASFGFLSVIGSLGLVGLSVNAAIIITSTLDHSPAAKTGNLDDLADTLVDATRHIVTTTATTIGGFLPLMFFWRTDLSTLGLDYGRWRLRFCGSGAL